MPERGRTILLFFGAYLIGKSILNLVLGFSVGNIVSVAVAVVMAGLLFFGVKFTNYIIPAFLAGVVLLHLKANIDGFPGTWLYLTEGLLDLAVAGTILFQPDIKAYFNREA